ERLDRLDADHENLRSATDWARDSGDGNLELRLVCALWWYWYVRGHWHEGRSALERVSLGGASRHAAARDGAARRRLVRSTPREHARMEEKRTGIPRTCARTRRRSERRPSAPIIGNGRLRR